MSDDFVWSTVGGLPLLLDDGDHAYLYGPSLTPVAQVDASGAVQYLHGDLLGSVRTITDSTGAVVGASTFDAFGSRTAHTGTGDSLFGFTGNWTDPDTGLVHLRARDYDPGTGQFLSVDPAVDATRQPYAYTGNRPLLFTDPAGLCPLTDGTNVADCTAEGLGGLTWLASGMASDVLDFLEPSANSFAGLADGATGGLTELGRMANGSDCQIEKDGWYWTEFGLGTVASLITGGAVIKALAKIQTALKLLNVSKPLTEAWSLVGHAAPATPAQLRALSSLVARMDEHVAKLNAYILNPAAADNLGHLANAVGHPDRYAAIIERRVAHLEKEIAAFQKGISEISGW